MKTEEHSDGLSLVPLMSGKEIAERSLVWHYPHYGNQGGEPSSMIRMGDWKLIHYYEDGREELYNLREDLQEQQDVANSNAELATNLSKQLFSYLQDVGARYPVADPEYDPILEAQYLEKVVNVRWPRLEKQRMDFLSESFDPGNQWWSSSTKD